MGDFNRDFRIHCTIRLRGKPISTSHEYKTEHFDDIDDMLYNLNEYIREEIEELEGSYDEAN